MCGFEPRAYRCAGKSRGGPGSQYQEFVPAFPPPLAPSSLPPLGLVKYLTLFWPRLRPEEPKFSWRKNTERIVRPCLCRRGWSLQMCAYMHRTPPHLPHSKEKKSFLWFFVRDKQEQLMSGNHGRSSDTIPAHMFF